MTWIEVLAGARSDSEVGGARRLLREDFQVVPVGSAIAERTLRLRRDTRLNLIDATVYATALEAGVQSSTRNTKDFSEADSTIRVPYQR